MKKYYVWIGALILLCFALTGLFLTLAPDQIPAHYNAQGEVDRWGSKYEYLIFSGIDLIFGALMLLTARYEGKKGRGSNEKIVGIVTVWVLLMFNALWIFFMAKAIDPDTAVEGLGSFAAKGIGMMLMVLFIVFGNIIPKVRRNSYIGLRTKWSMANDTCWQKSQRLGGYAMVLSGMIGIVLVALVPEQWMVWIMLGIVGVMLIVTLLGSYLIYRKEREVK